MAPNKQKTSAAEALVRSIATTARWLLVVSGGINLMLLIPSLYSMQVLGRVLPSRNLDTLIYLTVGAMASFAIMGVLLWVRGMIQEGLADWFERSLKPMLVRICLHKHITGVTAGHALSELQNVRQFIAGPAATIFFDAPWSILFAVVLWMLHPWLVVLALGGGLIMLVLAVIGEKMNRAPLKEVRDAQQSQQIWLEKLVRCLPSIRAMRLEDTLMNRWRDIDGDALNVQARMHKRAQLLSNIAQGVKIALSSLQTALAAYLMVHNELHPGAIMAVSMLSGRVTAPFEQAIGAWLTVLKARDSYRRLQSLTAIELPEDSMPLPLGSGKVTVSAMYWRPDGVAAPVLKGVNFEAQPGECVAILGPSGAGKSSLISLLSGIENPTAGAVRLDGAEIGKQTGAFGERIGYLPQIVDFFPGTIRENIARMSENIDDAAVVAAAESAGVHDLILSLPNGYNTIPEGLNLSMGQRQRIGLARALYGPVRLLLLDEPNAHVDSAGDMALMEALQRAKQAKITTFIVSHKTTVLSVADKCMVMANGEMRDYCDAATALEKYVGGAPAQQRPTAGQAMAKPGVSLNPGEAAALKALLEAQKRAAAQQQQQQAATDQDTPPNNPTPQLPNPSNTPKPSA